MRFIFHLFIFSFCFLSKTYSQKVVSLHPLYNEQDAILIPEVEGLWNIPIFDITVSFQKKGDNFYLLKYGSEKNASVFEAVFIKIKNELYLDLTGILPNTAGDEDYRDTFVPVHSFYKIQIRKDSMLMAEPNYSWFFNYATKNDLPLKYEWVKNAMLLTYKTDELKLFITENSPEQEMFITPLSLISNYAVKPVKTIITYQNSETKSSAIITQTCVPEFPLKEGWLGGDGDVSVPLNSTTTLFIFSDTWVGDENQQSRLKPGMRMVSNSVAVQTCLPNGGTDVKYFWNNKYSDSPEPIFRTYTDRYKFWIPDAFMINSNLYVLLEKIGTKPGAAPNEIFNFSLLGYTLAKISNPAAAPDKWDIEYIPLPDFKNPGLGIGPHVKLDGYLYFFINRNDKAQVLVRKQIKFIDDTKKPYEYFALNRTWKEGIKTNDMDTVVNGFRSTTVNYHPEMKQWVMICDVKFMDNKIKMRTAPKLTGPWSDEIDIYEIPEVTQGNPSYSESNFCYLARECIQNYDTKKHVMLITYDINNSNFSEINANPKIYTPKVITIRLK